MRALICLIVACLASGIGSAKAGGCVINGTPPQLDNGAVQWTMEIASGQSCVRGLRSGAMTLDNVSIAAPATKGLVTVQGYSFTYTAPANFKGEDTFSVVMSGFNRKIQGKSTIQIAVNVR